MYVIHFIVDNQRIYLKDPIQQILVANTIGYLYCDFTFKNQEIWKPELSKKASFSWGATTETRELKITNGKSEEIEIPFNIIQSPGFTVSVRGEAEIQNKPERITTAPFPIRITPSGDVTTDITSESGELPENTIETPRQIAQKALAAAEEAQRLSADAVGNVDAIFEIVGVLSEDTKKVEWVADRYLDFELKTAIDIANLKEKNDGYYNDLVSAKEKINGLLNSLSILNGNFDSLSLRADNLSSEIGNLFNITNTLGENNSAVRDELLNVINSSINETKDNLELLKNNLINYFLGEIEKSGLNLKELLQGDYDIFIGQALEKVNKIESLFSEFDTQKIALGGSIDRLNTYINTTFAGIQGSIENLFGNYETVSSHLRDTKEELKDDIADVLSNLDITNLTLFDTIADLKETQESLNKTKEELDTTMSQLTQTKEDLEKSIEDAQAQLEQTNQELATATGKAKEDLEKTKTELENTIAVAEESLAKTQEELNKTQASIETTKTELEATIGSVREELNGMIATAEEKLNGLLSQFSSTQEKIGEMLGKEDGYDTNTEISFGKITITTDTSDWGYLPSFDSFGNWTNTWLETHEKNSFSNIIFNLSNAREASILLVKDMQNIKGFLQTLSAGLSRAQSYINQQLTTLDSGIDEIQEAFTSEVLNRDIQYQTINNNINALFTNQSTINENLIILEQKHNEFETITKASLEGVVTFEEIKDYVDKQINSQIGIIINADY